MTGMRRIGRARGREVYDPSGEKIGTASMIHLGDDTGRPEWVTVRTGLFGTRKSFVPIRAAELDGDALRVTVSKEQARGAPRIRGHGHPSAAQKRQLARYYNLAPDPPSPADDTATAAGPAAGTGPAGTRPDGPTRSQSTTDTPTAGPPETAQDRARWQKRLVVTRPETTAGRGSPGNTAAAAGHHTTISDGEHEGPANAPSSGEGRPRPCQGFSAARAG